MDDQQLKSLIDQLENEKRIHGEKFGSSQAHDQCLPRFDIAIEKLKEELAAQGGMSDKAEAVARELNELDGFPR